MNMLERQGYNNSHIQYIIKGDGPPVILIHGITASHCDWDYLIPELIKSGYRVYALDLPGHGDSAKPDSGEEFNFEWFYDALVAWIRELPLNQAPVFVGHSLGGYLSLKYALDYPENISKLLLINPYYNRGQLSPLLRLINKRPAISEKVLSAAQIWLVQSITDLYINTRSNIPIRTRQQIALDYKRVSPQIVYLMNTIPDLDVDLAQVSVPTLVIWGMKDPTLNPGLFPSLVEKLPNAHGHAIPHCGHLPHLGKPEILNQLVLEFLVDRNPHRSHAYKPDAWHLSTR